LGVRASSSPLGLKVNCKKSGAHEGDERIKTTDKEEECLCE